MSTFALGRLQVPVIPGRRPASAEARTAPGSAVRPATERPSPPVEAPPVRPRKTLLSMLMDEVAANIDRTDSPELRVTARCVIERAGQTVSPSAVERDGRAVLDYLVYGIPIEDPRDISRLSLPERAKRMVVLNETLEHAVDERNPADIIPVLAEIAIVERGDLPLMPYWPKGPRWG